MKKLITSLFSACMLLASTSAFAEFGEKVNCTTQTTQITYYYGWASCRVGSMWLDQYVGYHNSPSYYVTKFTGGQFYSCWANLPFTGTQTLTSEDCDYKPLASANATSSWYDFSTRVTASGRDFDGSIVSNQLWINGQLQSSPSVVRFDAPGTVLSIRARTTDNDGYTHETTRTHVVNFQPPQCLPGEICQEIP